jgi:putative transposase
LATLIPARGAVSATCVALGISRASLHGCQRLTQLPALSMRRPSPPRALPEGSRQVVLDLLRSPRFADLAPAEIYATLLDQGIYHGSIRTMYRILDVCSEVHARRKQLRILSTPNLN